MSIPPRSHSEEFKLVPTPDEVASFRTHGFLRIERITTDEELAWLASIYDELFAAREGTIPGGYFDLSRPYDAEGDDLLPQVLFPEHKIPELRETIYHANARRYAAALLGVDTSLLRGWGHMIKKPAQRGHETPWHQDEAYWEGHLSYQAVGAWMPLDDATLESGCLQFIPGSHHGDVRTHRHIGDDPAVHGLVTDDVDPSVAVAAPLAPGGATFHHPRMVHYAGPNRTDQDRRAFAIEFQTTPVPRDVAEARPWVDAGREAWERRDLARPADR